MEGITGVKVIEFESPKQTIAPQCSTKTVNSIKDYICDAIKGLCRNADDAASAADILGYINGKHGWSIKYVRATLAKENNKYWIRVKHGYYRPIVR